MPEDSESTRRAIREAAAERVRLHAMGARLPSASPELVSAYTATGAFLKKLTSDDALERLRAGDTDALEYAACFLEVHPLCPDSGFAVRDLVKVLKHAKIPGNIAARLRIALLAIAGQPPRDELKHLRQLALKVADETFVSDLDRLGESHDIVAAANARVFADYITKHWDSPPWATQ